MSKLGGKGDTKDADANVKKLANDVKADVEKSLGTTFTVFDAVSYKTQVVAGTNFFVKVKVGDDKYVHLTVWKKLPAQGGALVLSKAEGGKTLADPL